MVCAFYIFKAFASLYDDFIKTYYQRRKNEYYDQHTDRRSSGHIEGHGADDINIRIDRYADSRCEKANCTDTDRRHGLGMGDHDSLIGVASAVPLPFISVRKQYRVVDCRTQLDGADTDRVDEGHDRSCIERNAQIDEDSKLDTCDEYERQR